MTTEQIEKFEEFLTESFEAGHACRELRLSEEEIEYIKETYPAASFKEIAYTKCSDRKSWFEVRLA